MDVMILLVEIGLHLLTLGHVIFSCRGRKDDIKI